LRRIGFSTNSSGSLPTSISSTIEMPSIVNARTMVFSRPIWSEIQPNSGRVKPL